MRISNFTNYLVQPGQNDKMAKVPADPWDDLPKDKNEAKDELIKLNEKLSDLQQRLFVEQW